MQTWSGDNQRGSGHQGAGKIAFYTLLCFSLAGLIAGFAFGSFIGHASGGSVGNVPTATIGTSPIPGHSPVASATATPVDVAPGEPIVAAGDYTSPEKADGTTSYTFTTQIVNKADKTPITATNVTCRLWLTDDANATSAALSANKYAIPRSPASFAQPFPHEVTNALNFASPSQQTQPCAANGKTRWTYTLAPTVHHGEYFLAVLADWKGIHYNWYMVEISVPKGGNG